MGRTRKGLLGIWGVFFFLAGFLWMSGNTSAAMSGSTEIVSVSFDEEQGDWHSSFQSYPFVSDDGRFVVFTSGAWNLVPNDTNEHLDVFIRDRELLTTERISAYPDGREAYWESVALGVSSDGNLVAFATPENLLEDERVLKSGLYIKNQATDQLELASLDPDGVPIDSMYFGHVQFSNDGRYVLFAVGSYWKALYLRDRLSGTTEQIVNAGGIAPEIFAADLSPDGRYITFSGLDEWTEGENKNNLADIYLLDTTTDQITLITMGADGAASNGFADLPSISRDGKFIVFVSNATNLTPVNENEYDRDAFLYERTSGSLQQIQIGSDISLSPVISDNGEFIVFSSVLTNLVVGDTNGVEDVFLYQRLSTQIERISINGDGSDANGESRYPTISADGRFIAFFSLASNLVPNDVNGFGDAFLHDRCPDGSCGGPIPTATPEPTPNSGSYTPTLHGYQFKNAASKTSWEIFKDTFGSEKVECSDRGKTIPCWRAEIYYKIGYKAGSVANCFGMAVSSGLLFKGTGWIDPGDFLSKHGAATAVGLPIPQATPWPSDDPIGALITRYQGYQLGQEYGHLVSAARRLSLAETIDRIKSSVDGSLQNPELIVIKGPDVKGQCGEHALFPYAYDVNGDETRVSVYDPNHEMITSQVVVFDAAKGSWTYNHNTSLKIWESGQTCNGVMFGKQNSYIASIPLSTFRQRPTPPWFQFPWDKAPMATADRYYVSVSAPGALLIGDAQGRQLGATREGFMEEIPGGYVKIPIGVLPDLSFEYPESYVISTTIPLTFNLIYAGTGQPAISGMVNGAFFDIQGAYFAPSPASQSLKTSAVISDTFQVSPTGETIHLTSGTEGGGRELHLINGTDTVGRGVEVGGLTLAAGETSQVSLTEVVTFTVSQAQAGYTLELAQWGITNTHFLTDGPPIGGGDIHRIELDWNDPQTATVYVDIGGDGSVDEVIILEERPNRLFLPVTRK